MMFKNSHKHCYLLIVIQAAFLVLFGIFVKYAPNADAKYHSTRALAKYGTEYNVEEGGGHHPTYGMFQDVHVMIFIGFGFLMTFLKRYGFGAVGFNFLIASVAIQWAILINGFFHLHHGYIEVSLDSLLAADFVAATVLITFGALLGKTTPTQLIMITIIEVPIFVINEVIGRKYFGAVDMGDSMFVHAFGAYFGLAVSRVIARDDVATEKEGSSKASDTFAMIGTIFLWVYWPSFNGGAAPGDDQHRAIINTYIALAACCVTAFAVSSFVDGDKKFDMVHVQNSTLAGGVAIGTSADMMAYPFGAMVVGIVAGILSVVGYHIFTPFLSEKLRIHDTCGVHNLHGMPAIVAGVVGAIYSALATYDVYGDSLYEIFPLRAPLNNTAEYDELLVHMPELEPGENRSGATQAGYQLLALVVTLLISLVGGAITGLIVRLDMVNTLETADLYEDVGYWIVEEEEEHEGARISMNPATPMLVEAKNKPAA